MYDNIGKKIKGLAVVSFILMALVPIFVGMSFISEGDFLMVIGLIIAVVGPILSWIFSLLLYGFGELVDKTCDIERNIRGTESESVSQSERISKIEELYSLGLITEDEYQQAISK